jgi:hypothetical protein
MLHLAEPYARLTIQAGPGLREILPFGNGGDIALVEDLAPALEGKRRAFDAGLFAMAAPGWLLGCNTLSECMKHPRLREYVGRTYNDELLPPDPVQRSALAPLVIQAFERFENPLNDNALLPSARPLLARFRRAVLPVIRAWADEYFRVYPNRKYLSKTLTVIDACPKGRSELISIPALNAFLAERNMQLGNGYGGLKDKTFRIAHMGELCMDDMKEITSAVVDVLKLK